LRGKKRGRLGGGLDYGGRSSAVLRGPAGLFRHCWVRGHLFSYPGLVYSELRNEEKYIFMLSSVGKRHTPQNNTRSFFKKTDRNARIVAAPIRPSELSCALPSAGAGESKPIFFRETTAMLSSPSVPSRALLSAQVTLRGRAATVGRRTAAAPKAQARPDSTECATALFF